jgi:hypothetical protein
MRKLLLIAGLVCALQAHAAIAFVAASTGSCTAVTACTITVSPTNGNYLGISALDNGTATTRSGSDGGTSVYATDFSVTCITGAVNTGTYGCLYAHTCAVAGSPTTVSANWSPADSGAVAVSRWSGGAVSPCPDSGSPGITAKGTGSTQTAGNLVTSNASDAVVGMVIADGSNLFAVSAPWNLRANANCSACGAQLGVIDQIVSATGTYTATSNTGATSVTWWASSAAFKAAAAGGATPAFSKRDKLSKYQLN